MQIPLCRWFFLAVVLLVIPATAAWMALRSHDRGDRGHCIEGDIRINDNGSPQICVKR